jgi:type IV pilus assembly protein PilX
MAYNRQGESAEKPSYFYRVTAIGFGVRDTTQVVLQTFYRKED